MEAGASTKPIASARVESKPLDGIDQWKTISENAASPRQEVVYNVEPFRAAIRQGDWKLVWASLLPPRVELYDLATDPAETKNLAAENPERVAALQPNDAGAAASPREGLDAAENELPGPVVLGGFDDRRPQARNARDGGKIFVQPIVADSRMFVLRDDAELVALN